MKDYQTNIRTGSLHSFPPPQSHYRSYVSSNSTKDDNAYLVMLLMVLDRKEAQSDEVKYYNFPLFCTTLFVPVGRIVYLFFANISFIVSLGRSEQKPRKSEKGEIQVQRINYKCIF